MQFWNFLCQKCIFAHIKIEDSKYQILWKCNESFFYLMTHEYYRWRSVLWKSLKNPKIVGAQRLNNNLQKLQLF